MKALAIATIPEGILKLSMGADENHSSELDQVSDEIIVKHPKHTKRNHEKGKITIGSAKRPLASLETAGLQDSTYATKTTNGPKMDTVMRWDCVR
jgi:hypothetical protein